MTLEERLGDILDPYVPDDQKVIMTNLIKATVLHFVPPPVDIGEKYETKGDEGVWVNMNGTKENDEKMLDFILQYGKDCGYNSYWQELYHQLKLQNTVV